VRILHRRAVALPIVLLLMGTAGCDLAGPAASVSSPPPASVPVVSPAATPAVTEPVPTPEPTFLIYQVRPNDSLTAIARRFKTTAVSIGYWNRTRYATLDPDSAAYAPDRIKVGWLLRIHPGQTTDGDFGPPSEAPSESPSGSPAPSASVSPTA
jgi:hypothetical protein